MRATGDIADAEHARLNGRHIAADDGLQPEHEMGLRDSGVRREVRPGTAMPTGTPEGHGPGVEIPCGAKQHCRVPVMAAGMHLTGYRGSVHTTGHFLDVQR